MEKKWYFVRRVGFLKTRFSNLEFKIPNSVLRSQIKHTLNQEIISIEKHKVKILISDRFRACNKHAYHKPITRQNQGTSIN